MSSAALARIPAAARARTRAAAVETLTAPPRLSVMEWSEQHRRWPDGSLYDYDRVPHLRELVAAYEDPTIEEITVMKVSQCGVTQGLIVNVLGYHIAQDPRDILLVIPAIAEAQKWSKKILRPTIDATAVLRGKLSSGSRKESDTMLEKTWPGGSLGIVGSNSARGFRMVTTGICFGDDVDGWDATAGKGSGSEGDQVTLIRRRTDRIADRKLAWISTPTRNGARIQKLYESMDRFGQWHVPCPECGAMQVLRRQDGLVWESEDVDEDYELEPGEVLRSSEGSRTVHRPDTAWYECEAKGCRIEESSKAWMEARGEYLADDGLPVRRPGARRVGYWIRGSMTLTLPGSEWPRQIREFLEAKDYPDKLQAFVNTVDGEPWETRGDAPEWNRLYERREDWPIGTCQEGVMFLTAGVDVQDNRLEAAVWGWGKDKESWLVDHRVFGGDPWNPETWHPLTKLLQETWAHPKAGSLPLVRLAVDTGFAQDAVVEWAWRTRDQRIMLIKGDHWRNWSSIIGNPSKSDVTLRGQKTGLLLWPVGGALVKQETYGFLRLDTPVEGQPFPAGYIHLPKVDHETVQSLVAEDLVTKANRAGFTVREWVKNRTRNEQLDMRVYARAAAEQMGLSRRAEFMGDQPEPEKHRPKAGRDDPRRDRGGGWLDRPGRRGGGRGGGRRGGGWLR